MAFRERRCGQEPDIFVVLTHRFVVALFLKKSFALTPGDDDLNRVDIVHQSGMRVDPSGLPFPAANMLEELNASSGTVLKRGRSRKPYFSPQRSSSCTMYASWHEGKGRVTRSGPPIRCGSRLVDGQVVWIEKCWSDEPDRERLRCRIWCRLGLAISLLNERSRARDDFRYYQRAPYAFHQGHGANPLIHK